MRRVSNCATHRRWRWVFGLWGGLAGLYGVSCASQVAQPELPKTIGTATTTVAPGTPQIAKRVKDSSSADPFDLDAVPTPPASKATKPQAPKNELQCKESSINEIDAYFAKQYRQRYCRLCADGVTVEPIDMPGRGSAPSQLLERTAAGLRGKRTQVALYYFYIPCKPCDKLLPYIQRAMKRRAPRELEVIPIINAPWDEVQELMAKIDGKFPATLKNVPGIYRDAAPRGARLRDIRKGVPVTIVFSGSQLSEVDVLYGPAQTRFWKRAADG